MFRFLVVEDEEQTLSQLVLLLQETFVDAFIETAEYVSDAIGLIEKVAAAGKQYDAALLDFKLPKEPNDPCLVVDESICKKIIDTMPWTLVLHITAIPLDTIDGEKITRHITENHIEPNTTVAYIIMKTDLDWPNMVLIRLKNYLYGKEIEDRLNSIFNIPDSKAYISTERIQARGFRRRSATHEIAALTREIVAHWHDIDDRLQEKIKKVYRIDEKCKPIRASLM